MREVTEREEQAKSSRSRTKREENARSSRREEGSKEKQGEVQGGDTTQSTLKMKPKHARHVVRGNTAHERVDGGNERDERADREEFS